MRRFYAQIRETVSLTVGTDLTIKLRREMARVGLLSSKDPPVIVVADTDCLPRMCYGSALSAYVLKHPGRNQLISGLSDSSLRFRDTSASSAAVSFFRDVSLCLLDPFPKSTEFSADDYVVLVAHPTLFQKFSEPFLCLIGMSRNYTLDEDTYPTFLHDDGTDIDLFAFIHVADPTKVKVREQERPEGEARLLDSTVERVVPLLPVAPACAESELVASVERLFDEGGSADQGNFIAEGGHDDNIGSAAGVRIIAAENVTAERPKRSHKKRKAATYASGSSHPPKKLKGDFGTSGEAATNDKSSVVLRKLLASNILNVEAGVAAVETLPVVTSLVSATPEHESGPPTDSIIGLNLRTLGSFERFVISSYSSHHSSTNDAEAGIDSFIRSVTPLPVMTEVVTTANVASIPSAPAPESGIKVVTLVHSLMFLDSDSTGMVKPDAAGSFHVLKNKLSMGYQDINFETLYKIREIDYHHLFTEFNVGTARQACLNAKVEMRTEYCLSERRKLESECEKQADLLKNATLENEKYSLDGRFAELQSLVSAWDLELEGLNAVVSSLRSQKDGLVESAPYIVHRGVAKE
nr:transposase (putative), gypsy type [Tanacetum cinerariifolium]